MPNQIYESPFVRIHLRDQNSEALTLNSEAKVSQSSGEIPEAMRKQASKKAVKKQFSGTGYESYDVMVIDEVELQRRQQLEKLYRSTRAGKDFKKDIV